jgi:acyl-CoA thioesterase FadM
VEIQLLVSAKTSKSITYQFRFRVDNAEVARGGFTVVCVRRTETGEMKATSIPPEIANLIEAAPAKKFAD